MFCKILGWHGPQEAFCVRFGRWKWGNSEGWCRAPGNLAHAQVHVQLRGEDTSFSCISMALKLDMVRDRHEFQCVFISFNLCLLPFLQVPVYPCSHWHPVFQLPIWLTHSDLKLNIRHRNNSLYRLFQQLPK